MNKKSLFVAGLMALSVAACTQKDKAPTNDEAGAVKAALPDKLSIFYGQTGPTAFEVPNKYQWSIGALLYNGQNFCTGTLIDYDVVLSAAHCAIEDDGSTMSTSGISFGIGTNMKNPTKKIAVKKIIPHANYNGQSAKNDVALFILSKPAKFAGGPELAPLPLNRASLSGLGIKGKIVQNVGYGSTENNNYNTKRFWTTEEVKSVNSYEFAVDGKGKSSVCFGDSGGPSLYVIDNQIRIIGTVSWGGESCVDVDHYASVADNISWINQQLEKINHAPLSEVLIPQVVEEEAPVVTPEEPETPVAPKPEETDTCRGYDYLGTCEGNVAVWCDGGVVYEQDCSLTGTICGLSNNNTGYYCNESTETVDTGCANLSYLGDCQGNTAIWCEDGEVKQRDCEYFGQVCDYIDASWGYYCK